jgi:LmbE family N-acetylglucosaminyl deacetylase
LGGAAALWAEAGHRVQFVSVTNGDAGHQTLAGAALARRRRKEAEAAGKTLGVEYRILDNHDGELMPTLENRREIIKIIRDFQPQIILGPRPFDYHPDHRYTAILVQDAAYMVTVPNIVASAPHLDHNPLIMYVSDHFAKPYPFTPDVVVSVDSVIQRKIEAVSCHVSQFFEWLPYNAGTLNEVPAQEEERQLWLREKMEERFSREAQRFRSQLIERFGAEQGQQVTYAEAFEVCEYGTPLTPELAKQIFFW